MNPASVSLSPSTPSAAPAAPKGAASGTRGASSTEAADASSFDRMLDSGGNTPAAPAEPDTPVDAAVTDAASATSAREATPANDAAPSAALPDQLLAMLGVLAPTPAPTAAAPQGGGALPAAVPSMPAPTGAARTAALPGLVAAPAAATAAPVPTLAADAAPAQEFGALLADARAEASPATPDAPTGLFAPAPAGPVALARPATAVPLLDPVAMPADPQAGLDDAFGSRIVWMAEQRIGHADIRVTPEHLGTIDVRVQLDGTQVRAEFFSMHADVRQALESSMARLRDQLGQHGLQLAQADVGQQRSGNTPQEAGPGDRDGESAEPAALAPGIVRTRRLLDEIA